MRLTFRLAVISLAVASACAQGPSFEERDVRYLLQPLDVLDLHFRYSPELDQSVTIQPDGFVSIPVVGDMKISGLTTYQAKQAIVEKASHRLRDPEVTLLLKEFQKPYFVVGGEVNTPGKFDLHGHISVLEALQIAGGMKTRSAKISQVILYHRIGSDLAQAQVLDLRKAMTPGGSTEGLPDLRSGDLLLVPQSRVDKIERFVKWATVSIYPPL